MGITRNVLVHLTKSFSFSVRSVMYWGMQNSSYSPEKTDVAIIGGGIIGLSVAYTLLQDQPNLKLTLFEKEPKICQHQTGRNSGVIHSGIYYPPKSEKARNCLRGYGMLIDFVKKNEIRHDLCGKVIVATQESEYERLNNILIRGQQNGLSGLKMLEQDEIQQYEPHCAGTKGIFVPQTGIVDYPQMCQVLYDKVIQSGGDIRLSEPVKNLAEQSGGEILIQTDKTEMVTNFVITTTGLQSDRVARKLAPDLPFKILPFRGEYFKLVENKRHLIKNLIYPVPDPQFPFLGVHFTRMTSGDIEAGPNAVLALAREGYTWKNWNLSDICESLTWPGMQKIMAKHWRVGLGEVYRSLSRKAFARALQRLVPEVEEEDLIPVPAGIRAQASNRKGLVDDFWLENRKNCILVLNAPSPAATSSLSIARTIADQYKMTTC